MTSDRDILIRALEPALRAEEDRIREALLRSGVLLSGLPGESILSPLADAIGQCDVYQAVAGHMLFTGHSGLVLHAPSLALPLLYRAAEWTHLEGRDIGQAADWLIRMLCTRQAAGTFTGAIWGLSINKEAPLTKHSRLVPFDQLPASRLKKQISDEARKLWNNAVWVSPRYFDMPGAAIVRKVADFPYICSDSASFMKMEDLKTEVYKRSVFLQGRATRQPLIVGYWFEYDHEDLHLNSHENYVSWMLPEVVPSIPANVAVDAGTVEQELKTLLDMPEDWRKDLMRSMKRFMLSQCRHQVIDRILDLTLAFEIAVSGKGEQAPQSWKVSVRSAQMIGGPLPDRQENRRKMVELYNLRNRGTHGSKLSGGDEQEQEAILTQAGVLYRKLLDGFWRHRARPDWDAIELGATSAE